MKVLSKEKFNKLTRISPNNIIEGFDKYNNAILTYNEKVKEDEIIEDNFINFILDIFKSGKTIIDDYYGNRLNDKEFNKMIESLEMEEKELLCELRKEYNSGIYFNIESLESLKLIIKRSVQSILFITFYILGDDLTIWCNYDYKFVMFFNDLDKLNIYNKLAESNNLVIKDIKIVNK